jgi:hypothetical protein
MRPILFGRRDPRDRSWVRRLRACTTFPRFLLIGLPDQLGLSVSRISTPVLITGKMDTQPKPVFTVASAVSLGFVASVGVVGYIAARALLPKNTRQFDRYVFIWFVSMILPKV